ncbi:MAG: hypothetical protein ABWX90_03630 [Candidatus Saccharimonadales bacterium]
MSSMRLFNHRAGLMVAAAAVLLGAVAPALVSAAQVTERSIELSSSSADASNVVYRVNFTPTQADATAAVVIDFCENSPVLGEACTAPAGFNASTATASGGFTLGTLATPADNKVMVTGAITTSPTSVVLTGVHNPTAAGTIYARILTYADSTVADDYVSTTPGAHLDDGGVALAITPTIGVSGAVLESMLFCVAKNVITANCDLTGNQPPTLKLGQDVGGVISLNSADVYTGTINTQISTNAANGAVISLKSSAVGCGGLINSSQPSGCFITPALQTNITQGQPKFGVKTAADSTDVNGTIRAFPASGYNDTTYALNWVSGDATGVTSTYGDPFLDTNSLPANNKNMTLTFGASASNQTPAGTYSADLSMIATGKF